METNFWCHCTFAQGIYLFLNYNKLIFARKRSITPVNARDSWERQHIDHWLCLLESILSDRREPVCRSSEQRTVCTGLSQPTTLTSQKWRRNLKPRVRKWNGQSDGAEGCLQREVWVPDATHQRKSMKTCFTTPHALSRVKGCRWFRWLRGENVW